MYQRFTDRARRAMQYASEDAKRFGYECIDTEDMLLGLVKEGVGMFASVLEGLQVDLDSVRLEVERVVLESLDDGDPHSRRGRYLFGATSRAKRVIEYALEETELLEHNYIGTEHILLGLLREQDGLAAQVMGNPGVTLQGARQQIIALLRIPLKPEDREKSK